MDDRKCFIGPLVLINIFLKQLSRSSIRILFRLIISFSPVSKAEKEKIHTLLTQLREFPYHILWCKRYFLWDVGWWAISGNMEYCRYLFMLIVVVYFSGSEICGRPLLGHAVLLSRCLFMAVVCNLIPCVF